MTFLFTFYNIQIIIINKTMFISINIACHNIKNQHKMPVKKANFV